MSGHPYKAEPMVHQVNGLKRAWKKGSEFALFWEMGTGKTFTVINLAAARYMKDQIEALIVICPTPIKLVWENEIDKWSPVECMVYTHMAGQAFKDGMREFGKTSYPNHMKVLIVGIEALSQGDTHEYLLQFAKDNKCMIAADESSRLKNYASLRTKRATKVAAKCLYRILMTGTPITQGVEDLFGQFRFLNPKIIGKQNFRLFKAAYCIMGGHDDKEIVDYQNLDQLLARVSPYVDIVKKEDVLDLPSKVYEKIVVEPSPNQLKAIKQLKDTMEAEQGDKWLITQTILERLTRFQQIIGGNFPFVEDDGTFSVEPIEGPNPKLNALMEVLEDLPSTTNVIIWARFRPEIESILNSISATHGPDSVAAFYGAIPDEERRNEVLRFTDGNARFMISNPSMGGMGQTWTNATLVIYFSNSFSYEDRVQSEDRAHRKGQTESVTYIDIEARHHYDKMIMRAVKEKGGLAKFVEENIAGIQAHENSGSHG